MSIAEVETSPKTPRSARSKNSAVKTKPASNFRRPQIGGDKLAKLEVAQDRAQITKQEQVLTLLNRPNGVSIEEIMQATDWQQHSVRGFLAGTVKKKLGFTLTSSKESDEARRYRVATRRRR